MRTLRWLALAGILLFLFGYATAVSDPVVAAYRVAVPGLTRPVRLVQLSDIHLSPQDMPPVRVARIVAQANALRPDIVLLTGDFAGSKIVDWPRYYLEQVVRPLEGLQAPLGVFAVPGNHDDPYWIRRVMAGSPVRLIPSRAVDVGPFHLVGIDDILLGDRSTDRMRAIVAALPPGKPVVAFAHEPDFILYLPRRVAVLVAGHTHGGQIAPFGFTPFRYWPFEAYWARYRKGVFDVNSQTLVISSGLGTTGIPVRIGVPPEIVVVTLVPAGIPPPAGPGAPAHR